MKIFMKIMISLIFVAVSAAANTNNDVSVEKNIKPLRIEYTPSCHFETLPGDRPTDGVEKTEAVVYGIIMAPIDGVAALFNLIPTK
ncbi:hypothetical protein [Sulfurimonas sp.]|uniref:hypothetical protein n=1 Tax=Sulfurimonas sp. TaxID=2022749 RepID=UPI003D0D3EF3